jgi:hypothetical protein
MIKENPWPKCNLLLMFCSSFVTITAIVVVVVASLLLAANDGFENVKDVASKR